MEDAGSVDEARSQDETRSTDVAGSTKDASTKTVNPRVALLTVALFAAANGALFSYALQEPQGSGFGRLPALERTSENAQATPKSSPAEIPSPEAAPEETVLDPTVDVTEPAAGPLASTPEYVVGPEGNWVALTPAESFEVRVFGSPRTSTPGVPPTTKKPPPTTTPPTTTPPTTTPPTTTPPTTEPPTTEPPTTEPPTTEPPPPLIDLPIDIDIPFLPDILGL